MKILIVGDLHITNNNLDIMERLFKAISKVGNSIPVIFLGDIFEARSRFSPRFIVEVQRMLEKYVPNNSYVLSGNHDMISTEMSLVELFPEKTIKILHPEIINIDGIEVAFLPYINARVFSKILNPNKININSRIVFSHLAIHSKVSPIQMESISQDWFKAAEIVFNGHIHKPHKENNIVFTGSVYPTSYDERDDTKYLYVLNTSDLSYKTIPLSLCSMVELDKFDPEFNNSDIIVYFSGTKDEAAKFDNVRKLYLRQDKSEDIETEYFEHIKDSFWNMVKEDYSKALADSKVNPTLIKESLYLFPEEYRKFFIDEEKPSVFYSIINDIQNRLKNMEKEIAGDNND